MTTDIKDAATIYTVSVRRGSNRYEEFHRGSNEEEALRTYNLLVEGCISCVLHRLTCCVVNTTPLARDDFENWNELCWSEE